jgi:TPR repeat protein
MEPGLQGTLPLAQAGNDRAMLLVGEMYLSGEGINENQTEGLAWREKAAQAGHQRDAYFVAGRYFAKYKADYAAAAEYVIAATELGHPEAQALAAEMYGSGLGVARDKAKAEQWYRLAAEHSESSWTVYLGARSYLDGAERNYGKAAELMRSAAEKGHGLAQDDLGLMYLEGALVPRDLGEAERWLTLAVEQGVPTAYAHLGTLYWKIGQPKNAVRCYIDGKGSRTSSEG